MLTDDQNHPDFFPTGNNIRRAIQWLVGDNQVGRRWGGEVRWA